MYRVNSDVHLSDIDSQSLSEDLRQVNETVKGYAKKVNLSMSHSRKQFAETVSNENKGSRG